MKRKDRCPNHGKTLNRGCERCVRASVYRAMKAHGLLAPAHQWTLLDMTSVIDGDTDRAPLLKALKKQGRAFDNLCEQVGTPTPPDPPP